MQWKQVVLSVALATLALVSLGAEAHAAGTVKDADTGAYAEIVEHHVKVVLADGFARTEVTQVFENPGAVPMDAIYEFPVPPDAALSEMKIELADRTLNGQVVPREKAESIYQSEKASGNQAGLATKDGHQSFRFSIANIPAASQATMTFVYYEPLAVDESVGRYLYPLQDGGTSGAPWTGNQSVSGAFSFELELKSTMPIESVTMPGENPTVTQLGYGHYQVSLGQSPANLEQDLVLEYRFPSDLPKRMDVFTHRPASGGPGIFMLVLTPGLDLPAATGGTDWVFILDVSGSMESKMATLRSSVQSALQKLSEGDRFRIIAFSSQVQELTNGFLDATPANIAAASSQVQALVEGGSTNLYDALGTGLAGVDSDRITSTVLVTDAETNTGMVDPVAFDSLLKKSDVRVYGLLLSNNANWPLMEIVTEASGGFYSPVSNEDDIAGQVQRAFNKATHEALHDVQLAVTGSSVTDTTEFRANKIYQGQQLVVFGRYTQPGNALIDVEAKLKGTPQSFAQQFGLPDVNADNAELEQLWALDMVHALEKKNMLGLLSDDNAKAQITELGVNHQLVTDYTAMIVVDEATLEKYGVEQSGQSSAGGLGSGPGGGASSGSGYSGSGDSDYAGAIDPGQLALWALLLLSLGLMDFRRRRRAEGT